MQALRGKVVLIDFWTYTCINCLRTLPYVRAWDERYRDRGLVVVGVHTPEFGFEKDTANVRDAIARNHLRYPVAQDNDYGTWDAWGNQYWPAKYLVDRSGQVRYTHFGEGDYGATESAIRSLLGGDLGARAGHQAGEVPGDATPETYLGTARAERWDPPAAARRARLPGRDPAEPGPLRARRPLEARRRIGGGREQRHAEGKRAREVRLPRARLTRRHAAHRRRSASTASARRRSPCAGSASTRSCRSPRQGTTTWSCGSSRAWPATRSRSAERATRRRRARR